MRRRPDCDNHLAREQTIQLIEDKEPVLKKKINVMGKAKKRSGYKNTAPYIQNLE
jgi:hypothetical protein